MFEDVVASNDRDIIVGATASGFQIRVKCVLARVRLIGSNYMEHPIYNAAQEYKKELYPQCDVIKKELFTFARNMNLFIKNH